MQGPWACPRCPKAVLAVAQIYMDVRKTGHLNLLDQERPAVSGVELCHCHFISRILWFIQERCAFFFNTENLLNSVLKAKKARELLPVECSFILKEEMDIPAKLNNKRGDKTHLLFNSRLLFLFKSDQCARGFILRFYMYQLQMGRGRPFNRHHFMRLYTTFFCPDLKGSKFHPCFTGEETKGSDFSKQGRRLGRQRGLHASSMLTSL